MCEAASNAVFRIAGAMCIERLVPPHLRQLGEARAVFWRVVFIIMHFSHQVLEASLTRSMHVASLAVKRHPAPRAFSEHAQTATQTSR